MCCETRYLSNESYLHFKGDQREFSSQPNSTPIHINREEGGAISLKFNVYFMGTAYDIPKLLHLSSRLRNSQFQIVKRRP